MLSRIVFVALGGAIGSVARYLVGLRIPETPQKHLPLATIIVNVTGALLIGLLWGFFDRYPADETFRSFLFIGVLGGYTTFSTFSLETFTLLRDGAWLSGLMNIVLSVSLGIGAVLLGFVLSRVLIASFK